MANNSSGDIQWRTHWMNVEWLMWPFDFTVVCDWVQ